VTRIEACYWLWKNTPGSEWLEKGGGGVGETEGGSQVWSTPPRLLPLSTGCHGYCTSVSPSLSYYSLPFSFFTCLPCNQSLRSIVGHRNNILIDQSLLRDWFYIGRSVSEIRKAKFVLSPVINENFIFLLQMKWMWSVTQVTNRTLMTIVAYRVVATVVSQCPPPGWLFLRWWIIFRYGRGLMY